MIKYVEGDLVEMAKNGDFDLIAQGCNCFCKHGAGIAKQIADEWPIVVKADRKTKYKDPEKLGKITTATVQVKNDKSLIIANLYTQYQYWGDGVRADYDAIRKCMRLLSIQFHDKKIGMPKIGAGLARGDWKTIEAIIEEELKEHDVTIVLYSKR